MRQPRKAETLRPIVRKILSDSGAYDVPVKVDVIAEHLGARIRYSPFAGELAGMLVRRDDGAVVIGVNSAHHINRQSFTIAHECGHLCLHKGKKVYIDRSFRVSVNHRDGRSRGAVDPDEIEANRFAAELLMPLDSIRGDIDEFDIEDDEVLKELAERYVVSVQALNYRVNYLLRNVI